MTDLGRTFDAIRKEPARISDNFLLFWQTGSELALSFPASFDWRSNDALAPVSLQTGQSCVGHSSGRLMETLYRLEGENVRLDSDQCHVCTFGLPVSRPSSHIPTAFNRLRSTGQPVPSNPPFFPGSDTTPADACPVSSRRYKIENFVRLYTDSDAKGWIANRSPIVGIINLQESFLTSYRDWRVYSEDQSEDRGAHAIMIIGYGIEGGQNYWIVQNSFGITWGKHGFGRIALGQCGLFAENGHIAYGLEIPN